MRTARIKAEGAGYYHVMSRIIERRGLLGTREKERFHTIMRQLEAFCGLRVVTHCILSNHFHILLEVPQREELSDEVFLERLAILYGAPLVKEIAAQLEELREKGYDEHAERVKARYTYRMYDLSEYMKTLKQKFTQYYNRKVGRKGTLWEERFKSVLVEGSEHALCTMAAYIDLNAVRAGIVSDPKDYRYCGYAEALGGDKRAREGLAGLMAEFGEDGSWSEVRRGYRELLYMQGEQQGRKKRGFSRQEVKAVLDAGGRLPLQQLLRCRVRYFSDGLVLGSREFVDETFARNRGRFGVKRRTGARPMKHGQWDGLFTMRDLRNQVIG